MERQLHRSHKAMLKEQLAYLLPRQLGIDEHSIHRGSKYAVTLVDLEHRCVYDVIEGKNAAVLAARLSKMKGRSQVRMVCIDLCAAFRSVVARVFSNPGVATDRFHVIKLITKSMHVFCKQNMNLNKILEESATCLCAVEHWCRATYQTIFLNVATPSI